MHEFRAWWQDFSLKLVIVKHSNIQPLEKGLVQVGRFGM